MSNVQSYLFPQYYPQVLLGIELAKEAGLISDKEQCKDIAGDVAKLTSILVDLEIRGAGIIAEALAGSCGRCACETVF
jgi:hypothetical protein